MLALVWQELEDPRAHLHRTGQSYQRRTACSSTPWSLAIDASSGRHVLAKLRDSKLADVAGQPYFTFGSTSSAGGLQICRHQVGFCVPMVNVSLTKRQSIGMVDAGPEGSSELAQDKAFAHEVC